MPDGEVWDNLVIEIQPNRRKGDAHMVWRWSFWDHLVQDYDQDASSFGVVRDSPNKLDVNWCPPGGKMACRNQSLIASDGEKRGRDARTTSGLSVYEGGLGQTGEKDWLHANSISYDEKNDQVLINLNTSSEFVIIQRGSSGGADGDILYRWGNPQTYRAGSRMEQQLFVQHSTHFIKGAPGDGNVLVFNNGRAPDRQWSTVEELVLPRKSSSPKEFEPPLKGQPFLPKEPIWSFGPRLGRRGSFFCTHISSTQRLPNGNTLVVQGPQGIIFEVTSDGDEVWRYINPVSNDASVHSVTRQGDTRVGGRFSLFLSHKYVPEHPGLAGKTLSPGRYPSIPPLLARRSLPGGTLTGLRRDGGPPSRATRAWEELQPLPLAQVRARASRP
eukprot:CAMPEP_0206226924 /NCGR_PEP_ID=MMETSP0047_2-20121206/8350_1 /ASSEMBLY_ACC=CAM_ASM_000192 /TAXON_ID=195065 /ORGANISM="Chroomonas mesostigmatica_cf, Strain CCMP1168" /LENGTH=385 /DNA_ID=CAMNT_0053650043 /DNA_START=153 /DNA_END=1310 /DNA_ORIENTATION=-